MSTRPSLPAATHGITLFARPVGIVTGFVQCAPSSVEEVNFSTASPMTPLTTGDWAQTAYRLPELSIAIVGKFPPVFTVPGWPRSATGRSTQLTPLGSVTTATG